MSIDLDSVLEWIVTPNTESMQFDCTSKQIKLLNEIRRNYQHAINDRSQLYVEAIESIPVPIFMKDCELNVVLSNRSFDRVNNSYLKNNTYHIADDKMEVIQTTYAELVELNKGKDPSDYMQKLMSAYETFIKEYGKNDGFVSGKAIDELNKRAVKYYDKRSGIIKGPNTGKGQGRLKTVEKLLKATDPLTKTVNKGLGTAYKKFEAEQKKAQPKVPGKA